MQGSQVPVGYKLTQVGVIPEDWDVAEAWEVCELVVDCKNRTPPVVESSDFAVVRTPNVRHGKFIREELRFTDEKSFIEWTARAVPQVGDVLVTREAPLGEVCLVPDDLKVCLGQRMMLYRPDAAKTDSIFLLYALMSSSVQTNLHKKIGGSTVGHARVDDIRNLQIPFPKSKVEQEAIALVLSDIDALITSLDKLIAKKRDIKQAAMQQLLTGKQRLEGFGDSSGKFKQTEIGLIPKDWEFIELGNIGRFKNGINKSAEDFGFGSPFVNLMDIFGVSTISTSEYFGLINSNDIEKKTYDLKKGDVIFVRSSVKPSGVGLTTVIVEDLPNVVYSGFLIRFRSNDSLDLNFKRFCFLGEKFRKSVIANSTVSANTNINQDSLKKLYLSFPRSIQEQAAIAKVLSDMESEISALEQRRDKTKALKQAMMQELLTGKTRLK